MIETRETCEGCVHYEDVPEAPNQVHRLHWCVARGLEVLKSSPVCELLVYSLACRRVRATETTAEIDHVLRPVV
jgi:hypothetical protein